jgi:hypothetical protein
MVVQPPMCEGSRNFITHYRRCFAPCMWVSSHRRVVNVHLSINFQIYDWRPEFYNDTNNLPEKMPRHLKEHIYAVARKDRRMVSGHVFPY